MATNPTWKKWARTCAKDPSSPSLITREALAALTGQDAAALEAIAACWELYARADRPGQRAALEAVRRLVFAMQPHLRWVARELIPYALDWPDRERLWPDVDSLPRSVLHFEIYE